MKEKMELYGGCVSLWLHRVCVCVCLYTVCCNSMCLLSMSVCGGGVHCCRCMCVGVAGGGVL